VLAARSNMLRGVVHVSAKPGTQDVEVRFKLTLSDPHGPTNVPGIPASIVIFVASLVRQALHSTWRLSDPSSRYAPKG
jgi:hypothetical protein